jgi:hypothetical protein
MHTVGRGSRLAELPRLRRRQFKRTHLAPKTHANISGRCDPPSKTTAHKSTSSESPAGALLHCALLLEWISLMSDVRNLPG